MSIKIKTQSEINLMRESGHILANVFKEVWKNRAGWNIY